VSQEVLTDWQIQTLGNDILPSGQQVIGGLSLRIRDVTKLKDGIYILDGRATGEGVIPDEWTDFVADYLPGKPSKWRHERDKTLGQWAKASYGEVHQAKPVSPGVIDVQFHLFGTSKAHESLIEETYERKESGEPFGLSITVEQHSRDGKLRLVYPVELTITPVPKCVSCLNTGFNEKASTEDSTMADEPATLAAIQALQDQVTKKDNEINQLNESLVGIANESKQTKEEFTKILAEKDAKIKTLSEELVKRTDELKTQLAESQKELSKVQKQPLIEAILAIEQDQDLVDNVYNEMTVEQLQARLKKVEEKSVGRFEIAPAITLPGNDSYIHHQNEVRGFIAQDANRDLKEALLRRIQREDASRGIVPASSGKA